MQSSTNADLEAAFGLGVHTVEFTVTDKAGGSASASAGFEVLDTGGGGVPMPVPVPEPNSIVLMMLGLLGLVIARRRSIFLRDLCVAKPNAI